MLFVMVVRVFVLLRNRLSRHERKQHQRRAEAQHQLAHVHNVWRSRHDGHPQVLQPGDCALQHDGVNVAFVCVSQSSGSVNVWTSTEKLVYRVRFD